MIYICTALPFEARPFIDTYKLKSINLNNTFSIYQNESITLIITGSNPFHAAIGVTYLLGRYPVKSEDLLINIGICGAVNENCTKGTAYFIHKIKDHSTGMTFFPDILFKHPFEESSLETFPKVVQRSESISCQEQLVDMEASGIYMAALPFMKPHQLIFLKVVSDHLDSDHVTPGDVTDLIAPYTKTVIEYASNIIGNVLSSSVVFSETEEHQMQEISALLHLSKTLEAKLRQLLLYSKSRGNTISSIMNEFLNLPNLKEITTKTEGKKYFELLQNKLIR